jgi:uncharacterized protein YndB with AHSA1/START domain
MSTETVLVSEVIAAPKERLYAAWLDSDEHSAFIADVAAVEPFVGGSHSSFGGYATGKVLALEPNQKIVQSWRASDFPDGAPDSRLEVTFEETVGGTLITVLHTGLPAGQSDRYRDSWLRHYFAPRKTYFASDGSDDEIVDRTSETNGMSDGDTEELSVSASQIESMTAVISDIGEDDDDEEAAPAPVAKPARAKAAPKRRPVKKAAPARSKGAKKKASKIARPAARTKAAAKRKAAPKGKAMKAKAKAKKPAAKATKKPAKKAKKSRR